MVGARAPATRRRSARFARRYAPTESSRRPALECIFAHDGPGRRPIEVSERNFFAELKRRNVYKVAVAYAIVGWLLVQVATQVFPFFEIPNWAVPLVVLAIVIGFPIALVIAWAFELTSEGLKRTEDVDFAAQARRKPYAWDLYRRYRCRVFDWIGSYRALHGPKYWLARRMPGVWRNGFRMRIRCSDRQNDMNFFAELKRRNAYKVAVAYGKASHSHLS